MPTETEMEIVKKAPEKKDRNVVIKSHSGTARTLHVKPNPGCVLVLMKETQRIGLDNPVDVTLESEEIHWIVEDAAGKVVGQDPPVIP